MNPLFQFFVETLGWQVDLPAFVAVFVFFSIAIAMFAIPSAIFWAILSRKFVADLEARVGP